MSAEMSSQDFNLHAFLSKNWHIAASNLTFDTAKGPDMMSHNMRVATSAAMLTDAFRKACVVCCQPDLYDAQFVGGRVNFAAQGHKNVYEVAYKDYFAIGLNDPREGNFMKTVTERKAAQRSARRRTLRVATRAARAFKAVPAG